MLYTVFALGMVPTLVWADSLTVYEPTYIPKCTVFVLADGREICGFEASVWFSEVLTVDADLVHAKSQLKNEKALSSELALQIEVLGGQIVIHEETEELLTSRMTLLDERLVALDKKYQHERAKPHWGSVTAWTVAAVSSTILAGFLIKGFAD